MTRTLTEVVVAGAAQVPLVLLGALLLRWGLRAKERWTGKAAMGCGMLFLANAAIMFPLLMYWAVVFTYFRT
jgi:Na+/phosphate symporter